MGIDKILTTPAVWLPNVIPKESTSFYSGTHGGSTRRFLERVDTAVCKREGCDEVTEQHGSETLHMQTASLHDGRRQTPRRA
ncbi:hypothetical protein CC1G_14694 [Coprinopsis cinerea okayama7|uniref:Uncharacterized protein n=1 Tax=Coprinopsis cinerea (strain Okayama-7 / 130 / ATCC MYA-4618 / FGSC 9003) TaxID=240176 RepID=D6RMK8_COPC7|nr:hypothetical protein CC1G_14694 [Coprinopsis cinerea okayama7\|eukprot:XP_002911265.1 hypothetical protein CC1G_14694 [Coprinopsis cinerea okayama7\